MPALFDSDQTNNLRLMYWVVSLEAANGDLNAAIWIYRLMRLMYGDAPAACYLKLGLRRIIAPQCKTQLGRQILGSDRYVDDVLSEDNNAQDLILAMEETLERNGSTIKKIISNGLSYHAKQIPAKKTTPPKKNHFYI